MRTRAILERLNPDVLAIETQYISIRSNSVIKVIEVKGIIEGVYLSYCLEKKKKAYMVQVMPSEAKKAIGVVGRLPRKESKAEVKRLVTKLYPSISNEKQDIHDAVAIGMVGCQKFREKKILSFAL